MSIEEVLFFIGFLVLIGIALARVYNIIIGGNLYNLPVGIITLIVFFLAWFVVLVTFLINPEELVLLILFSISNLFLLLNIMFFIIEVIFHLKDVVRQPITSYKPIR